MLIPLDDIKAHLRIDDLEPDDVEDGAIVGMYNAALDYAKNYCGREIPFEGEDELNPSIRSAILLIIGDLYANRENVVVGASVANTQAAHNLMHFHRKGLGI